MINATDIDELPEDIDAEVSSELDDTLDAKPVKARRFVGYKTLGLATIIAALLGAGGGGVLSKVIAPSLPNLSPMQAQIETALSDNKALKAQLTRLQQDVKKQGVKTSRPKIDLSKIESRLTDLETAAPQTIEVATPIDPDLVARLEALQSEGSDALDLSDILARLEKLETKTSAGLTLTPAEREDLLTDLKSDLMANDSFDMTEAVASANARSEVPEVSLPDVLPTFPKAAILAALAETDKSGWLKQTLNKRITVQSENNPRYLVKLIETDLEAGHILDALMKFDKLPETAKTAAQDWRNAFKDTQ